MSFKIFLLFLLSLSFLEGSDFINYRLGLRYKESGEYSLAAEEFRKVLALHPDHYLAYYELAEIHFKEGNHQIAEFHLNNALRHNPGWPRALRLLAETHEAQGDREKAIFSLQQARRSSGEDEKELLTSRIEELMNREEPPKEAPKRETPPQRTAPATTPTIVRAEPRPQTVSQEARQELEKGIRYYRDGVRSGDEALINRALEQVRKAIALSPGYPLAYYYGGVIRRRRGENNAARINFERALSDPEMGYNAHFYLGRIYGDIGDYAKGQEHLRAYRSLTDYEPGRREALDLIERYQALIDAETERQHVDVSLVTRSTIFQELQTLPPPRQYSEMEIRLDDLLSMVVVDTLTDEGQAMLEGVRLFNANEFDKSIEAFYNVLSRYSSGAVAGNSIYNIAVGRLKLRDWDGAAKMFRQYIDRFPEGRQVAVSQFLEAQAYFEMRNTEKALDLFQRFIRQHRGNRYISHAYERMGDIHRLHDQQGLAADSYRGAIQFATTPRDTIFSSYKLGEVLFNLQNWQEGINAFRRVIEVGEAAGITERVPDSYYQLADRFFIAGDMKGAKEKYNRVIRKYPDYKDSPWGWFQLGNIALRERDFQGAIEFYDEVVKRFPEDYWAKQAEWKKSDALWEYQYGIQ